MRLETSERSGRARTSHAADLWPQVTPPFRNEANVITTRGKAGGTSATILSRPVLVTHANLAYAIAGSDFERHTCLDVIVDGRVVRSDTGRGLESRRAASFDVRAWLGREVQLALRDESGAAGWIEVGPLEFTAEPVSPPQPPLYREALRPSYHFTARQWTMSRSDPTEREEGWLNDLNGLIKVDGEFHLFAQRWNKCWIHAVSSDLVHWTELPPAFFETDLGGGVQSGTCVIDRDNTSGLGKPGAPAMVAFWSADDNLSQCISYSTDNGRTWEHWAGNPIMLRPERDPMVFRDHRRDRWCMVLYGNQRYELLASADLLKWEPLGDLADGFECPDFFELPVEGTDETRWVLVRGDGKYSIGSFDGNTFAPESDLLVVDPGPNFYATQSWDASEGNANRRVQTAWIQGSTFPRMPFSQQVAVPCDLALRSTDHGVRLHRTPVPELTNLERRVHRVTPGALAEDQSWSASYEDCALRLRANVRLGRGSRLELSLCGRRAIIEADAIFVDGARQPTLNPVRSIDILLDVASVEIFANDGEASITQYSFAGKPVLRATARGGPVDITTATVAELDSIWP